MLNFFIHILLSDKIKKKHKKFYKNMNFTIIIKFNTNNCILFMI